MRLTSLLVSLLIAPIAVADDAPLAPGQALRITMPELPPTYRMMHGADTAPTTLVVRLPDDYAPDRAFPLFVFLGGGWGGNGMDLSVPSQVSRGTGYIAANFPLFRAAKEDPEEPWGLRIDATDGPTISRAFTMIMDRLRAEIPNIDAERSVLGGHSNGAYTISVLLSALDENILRSFGGFFFVDGGWGWSSYHRIKSVGHKHILYMAGDGQPNPPWWREHRVNHMKFMRRVAKELGVTTWRFEIMEGHGHEFPISYHPLIREWLATM